MEVAMLCAFFRLAASLQNTEAGKPLQDHDK